MKKYRSLLFIAAIVACILAFGTTAFAAEALDPQEQDAEMLRLYYPDDYEQLLSTATRFPKPKGQIAENITVITKQEIEDMNAHTLADILLNVNGVQLDVRGGLGSDGAVFVQGSDFRHVRLLVDGVSISNTVSFWSYPNSIPAQIIEKVEIISGPASSAWGSSLSGVINVITKPAGYPMMNKVAVSASYGQKNTGDYRLEAHGGIPDLTYYLYAGNLTTNGLAPNTSSDINNVYSKVEWELSDKAKILWTFGYYKNRGDNGAIVDYDLLYKGNVENIFSTLGLAYNINDELKLDLKLQAKQITYGGSQNMLSTGEELLSYSSRDQSCGLNANLAWKHGFHNAIIGMDYDNSDVLSAVIDGGKKQLTQFAVYVNDTLMLNDRLALTAGARYDHTNTNGDFISPSLGATYKLDTRTLLKATVSKGFSIPPFSYTYASSTYFTSNPELKPEKVWSAQAGIETTQIKYLWLKASLFRHDIKDIIDSEAVSESVYTFVNKGKAVRQGIEINIKTVPVYNTSLQAGFSFIDMTDKATGEVYKGAPRYTSDIGLRYSDKRLTALLIGHYIWWNTTDYGNPDWNGKYNNFIWNLSLNRNLYTTPGRSADIFMTAHNLLNGNQYMSGDFRNPKRWIEAGVRYKF